MAERKGKVTSIRIRDEGLWKEAKMLAIEEDTTLSELVEDLLRKELAKKKSGK